MLKHSFSTPNRSARDSPLLLRGRGTGGEGEKSASVPHASNSSAVPSLWRWTRGLRSTSSLFGARASLFLQLFAQQAARLEVLPIPRKDQR